MEALYEATYLEPLLRSDPWLGWSGRPGAAARVRSTTGETVEYTLNHNGWRDEEFNPLNRVGNAIVLGDAYTFGQGVAAASRYPEALENLYRGLAVWDLAVPGYAPDQLLIQAERWLPPFPWLFAVLQLSPDGPALVGEHEWRGVHSVTGIPSSIGAELVLGRDGSSAALNLLAALGAGRPAPSPAGLVVGLKRSLFSVREIAKLSGQRKIPLLVLESGGWDSKEARQYHDGLVALAREQNFSLLASGPLETLPGPDRHWSAQSHRRVAEMLSPEVFKILYPAKPKR